MQTPISTLSVRPAWVEGRNLPDVVRARNILLAEKDRLDFDAETHTYTDRKTGFQPACVSDVVATWCTFDAPKKAEELHRRDFGKKGAKYYGMTVDDILEAWEKNANEAASRGTVLHTFAEACFCVAVGAPEEVDPEWRDRLRDGGRTIVAYTPQEAGIIDAWNWMPDYLIPVVKECRLYNDELGYAGTLDLLCYDCREEYRQFVLLDWKTNESLDKGHFDRMLTPFNAYWDVPLYHYTLQQSLYQIRLQKLGICVMTRYLLHIDPMGIFSPVWIEDVMGTLQRVLEDRKVKHLTADGKKEIFIVTVVTDEDGSISNYTRPHSSVKEARRDLSAALDGARAKDGIFAGLADEYLCDGKLEDNVKDDAFYVWDGNGYAIKGEINRFLV